MRKNSYPLIPLIFAGLLLAGCGDDATEGSGGEQDCRAGEQYNPVAGQCERLPPSAGDPNGTDPDPNGTDPNGTEPDPNSTDPNGTEPDPNGTDPDPDPNGTDPNGTDPDPNPGTEFCGLNMNLDADVECTFYAHSPNHLYRVDPFRETVEVVFEVPNNLFDIDTTMDGRLYGITTRTLYKYDYDAEQWNTVGEMGVIENANGLCINTLGQAFMTANNVLYQVDLDTAAVTTVGNMGFQFNSSGDCVIDKGDRLYMSSNAQLGPDTLVEIDGQTANATTIGSTGFHDIYGLTAGWGLLIGTTGNGEVILINDSTGEGELMFVADGISFYGAASTVQR